MLSKLKLNQLYFKDTQFANLMTRRIFNVLLIANPYDAFMLEDDGRIDEKIFNEYTSLSLRYPPRFTQVSTCEEALAQLSTVPFDLIICMPGTGDNDSFDVARHIKSLYRHVLFYETVGYILPVLSLCKHDNCGFYDNSYSQQPHYEDYKEVAGHDIFLIYCQVCFLFNDSTDYLIKYGGLVEVCKSLSLVAMYSSMRDWRLFSINSELRVRASYLMSISSFFSLSISIICC